MPNKNTYYIYLNDRKEMNPTMNSTFCGQCIIVYLYKNQQDALFTLFIPINNLYMFQAGLLLIIRRYYSVYKANEICHMLISTGCYQDWSETAIGVYHANAGYYQDRSENPT
jgi:hypothetical protein